MPDVVVTKVQVTTAPFAADLLCRFFAEEGFRGDPTVICRNLTAMLVDPNCWVALAVEGDAPLGVVTVSTSRDIEYGRLAEIGDLYVLPDARNRGIANRLIKAATSWCREAGCSAALVTVTPEGDRLHGLRRFYARLGFESSDRMISEFKV